MFLCLRSCVYDMRFSMRAVSAVLSAYELAPNARRGCFRGVAPSRLQKVMRSTRGGARDRFAYLSPPEAVARRDDEPCAFGRGLPRDLPAWRLRPSRHRVWNAV
jgi:hypothetical protein